LNKNKIVTIPVQDKKRDLTFFRKVLYKFKYGLVLQTIRNQLARFGIVFTPFYWVQEGINSTEVPEIRGAISDFTVEFLEAEDLKNIGKNIHGYSAASLLADLKEGNLCLGLKINDEIASFMWIELKKCSFIPINKPLKADEAYLTSMHTIEYFRGKNLAPYLRYKSYEILKKMGRDKIYSVSELFNSSAIRYKQKLNAKNLKLVLYIQLFKRLTWSFTLKTF
jgi:hypothetical protein